MRASLWCYLYHWIFDYHLNVYKPERLSPAANSSGYCNGSWIVSRISDFTSAKPPTSSHETSGIWNHCNVYLKMYMNLLKARYFNLYEVCTAYHYQHYLIISYKYKWKNGREGKSSKRIENFHCFFFMGYVLYIINMDWNLHIYTVAT